MPLIGRLINLTAGAAGASATAQFPEFYQQYLQRLGGRVDQAVLQANRIREAAAAENLTLSNYLDSFLTSQVSAHRRQGEILIQELDDADRLRDSLDALTRSQIWERPFVMLSQADTDILQAAATVFKPAVPITPEGFVYAAVGVVLGIVLLKALLSLRFLFRRKVPQ
jgi:hypothetical protein